MDLRKISCSTSHDFARSHESSYQPTTTGYPDVATTLIRRDSYLFARMALVDLPCVTTYVLAELTTEPRAGAPTCLLHSSPHSVRGY